MHWDYNIVPLSTGTNKYGISQPYGIKITKTLYDDSNIAITTVDASAEDVRNNAGPEFIQEYFDTAKQIFLSQVDSIFTYSSTGGYPVTGASVAHSLGFCMFNAVGLGLEILGNPGSE